MMGDRANVFVRNSGPTEGVFLYTHWSGSDLPSIVQEALKKKWRWDDDAYLARIILDTMTELSHGEETGYGISIRPPDGSDRVVYIDPSNQNIGFTSADSRVRVPDTLISFDRYCKLDFKAANREQWEVLLADVEVLAKSLDKRAGA